MNPETLHKIFTTVKPLCDSIMYNPHAEVIKALNTRLQELKPECVQELQHYVLYPVFAHVKAKHTLQKYELKCQLLTIVKTVVTKSTTYIPGKLIQKHITSLLDSVYDGSEPIAGVPEELLLAVTECLTALMLKLEPADQLSLFQTQAPLLARVIYVTVQIAKTEKLRALRLSAIGCVTSYTALHPVLANRHGGVNKQLQAAAADLTASILPGVLAALQDVATSTDNPGHAVVVAALSAIHKIICQVMANKCVAIKDNVSVVDFAKIIQEKSQPKNTESVAKKAKEIPRKSPEWYQMAGEKLTIVIKSLTSLQTHDHVNVRMELAVLCTRILLECSRTMQPSMPYVLDVLIALSNDEYPKVRQRCHDRLTAYFTGITDEAKGKTLDGLLQNLDVVLQSLPRILNNIDSSRKLAALNLLYGYLSILSNTSRPLPLPALCQTLIEASRHSTDISLLAQLATRDVTSSPPQTTPWCKMKHLDDLTTEQRLQAICRLLGNGEWADLLVDELMDAYEHCPDDRKEVVWLLNWIGSAPNNEPSITKRILDKYTEHDSWYLPLEVATDHNMAADTLDLTVYNPLAWEKDSVPGLYEGAVETRYTDISYATPRVPLRRTTEYCATLAEAQSNMVMSCSLTEGLGMCAKRLADEYQSYLLKTLCLVLERVGSKYELLHLSGLRAINDIAAACGHKDVADLIRSNADYFTYQVTVRLKKAWNSKSALEILTVILDYSDSSILDCLYGIVSDVLVQSCDKYYKTDLSAYLQVFLAFVNCIHKWFPPLYEEKSTCQDNFDPLSEAIEFMKNEEQSERLLSNEEFEKERGKSAEEMYREDLEKKSGEDDLDYDDTVTEEKKPPPQHITLTVTILKRCLNFIPSKRREEKLLALQVINRGLPILRDFEDELLPLVHLVWAPLVVRFGEASEPVVVRGALQVLVTMADLSKDFIRNRTVKEVLPQLFQYLKRSSNDSRLKDVGSAYRSSQAYKVQLDSLDALPRLAVDLCLQDETLEAAMDCAQDYLSDKQPKPLQVLAVKFFQAMLRYDHGAAWHHLRKLCGNKATLQPPDVKLRLSTIAGTPYEPTDKSYRSNIEAIFDIKSR